ALEVLGRSSDRPPRGACFGCLRADTSGLVDRAAGWIHRASGLVACGAGRLPDEDPTRRSCARTRAAGSLGLPVRGGLFPEPTLADCLPDIGDRLDLRPPWC